MKKENACNFEVRITDLQTGEEKYVGLSNCFFLAAYEDCGTRLIRLSQCDLLTKAACYQVVKFGVEDTFRDEPVLAALVNAISGEPLVVKEDV